MLYTVQCLACVKAQYSTWHEFRHSTVPGMSLGTVQYLAWWALAASKATTGEGSRQRGPSVASTTCSKNMGNVTGC